MCVMSQSLSDYGTVEDNPNTGDVPDRAYFSSARMCSSQMYAEQWSHLNYRSITIHTGKKAWAPELGL